MLILSAQHKVPLLLKAILYRRERWRVPQELRLEIIFFQMAGSRAYQDGRLLTERNVGISYVKRRGIVFTNIRRHYLQYMHLEVSITNKTLDITCQLSAKSPSSDIDREVHNFINIPGKALKSVVWDKVVPPLVKTFDRIWVTKADPRLLDAMLPAIVEHTEADGVVTLVAQMPTLPEDLQRLLGHGHLQRVLEAVPEASDAPLPEDRTSSPMHLIFSYGITESQGPVSEARRAKHHIHERPSAHAKVVTGVIRPENGAPTLVVFLIKADKVNLEPSHNHFAEASEEQFSITY
ncbi:hypothetical protein FDECE_3346 [Fusarium decemcellulare]|nr:hypothetical protein FDECE_3346 [Fusarium decemcellulare]